MGHLIEMAKASRVVVDLYIDAIPVLPGAIECVQKGVLSSLYEANLKLSRGSLILSLHFSQYIQVLLRLKYIHYLLYTLFLNK